MQASKIKIDGIYAIREGNGLRMFRVASVTTTRSGTSPHDYKSTVNGYVLNDDRTVVSATLTVLDPDRLLGDYTEHVELIMRETALKDAKERERAAKEALQQELIRRLYALIGEPMPEKFNASNASISAKYSYGVEINHDVVERLIKALPPVSAEIIPLRGAAVS